ncbi:hypothetical protein HDU67_007857 [Dinochytrium kinnereticum]|nr:hypothetical protein HDU67_007857 [Dinochytrium kinnereticum]
MVLPFYYFSHEGKFSRVRWSTQSTYNSDSLSFVTGTYDESDHSLVLWNCEPTAKEAAANPNTLWEAKPVHTLRHAGAVMDIAFVHGRTGPSGLPFMVSASSTGHVGIFTCSETTKESGIIEALGSQQFHMSPNKKGVPCFSVAIQPNASGSPEIASAGSDGHIVFSTLEGQKVGHIQNADSSQITSLKWTTTNEVVVSTEAGRLKLFDRRQKNGGLMVVDSADEFSPYNCIAVHPTQATRLATGSQNGAVKIWDLRSTSEPEVETYQIHSSDVWEVLFHPADARRVLSCSEDGKTSIDNLEPVLSGRSPFSLDQKRLHQKMATDGNKSPPRGFLGSSLFPKFTVNREDDEDIDEEASQFDVNLYRSISTKTEELTVVKKTSSFPAFPSFSSAPQFPSFSSFQAPEPSKEESRREAFDRQSSYREESRARSRSPSSKKRSREKSHKHKEEKEKKKDRKKHKHDKHEKSKPEVVAELASDLSVFYIDRKGDQNLLRYECLSRSEIPAYKRSYWAPTVITIDQTSGKKGKGFAVKIAKGAGERIPYADFKKHLKMIPVSIKPNMAKPKSDESEFTLDFIPLEDKNEERDLQKAETYNFSDNPEYMRKTEEHNKKLNENPKNRTLWLEFIKFQDTLLNESSKKTLKRAVNDKKLAIYEKAFFYFPDDDELLAGYMACCSETWETTRLLTKWDKILKQHIGSFLLWTKYLEFRQTNYTTFSVTECLEVYEDCIAALSRTVTLDSLEKERIISHIFIRACFMLLQAGFIERAISCFQAMIEFSAFCPPAFETQTFQQRLDMFEAFWESECPRFGEEGATGWKANIMTGNIGAMSTPKQAIAGCMTELEGEGGVFPCFEFNKFLDEFQRWFREESIAEYRLWLPMRSNEEGEDDDDTSDPYRSIIFDDIKPLMFNCTHPSTKRNLITSFLHLLSSQLNLGQSSKDPLMTDPFLHAEFTNEACAVAFLPAKREGMVDVLVAAEEPVVKLDFPLKSVPVNARNLVGAAEGFGVMGVGEAMAVEAAGDGRRWFIKNVLLQSRSVIREDFKLLPALLAFETCFGIKSGMKFGKSLLKTDRLSLPLWVMYADLEASRGNNAEALKIFQIALKSYKTFPKEFQADAPLLHHAFAEFLIKQGSKSQAINVLALFFDNGGDMDIDAPLTPTKLLKARKGYQDLTETLLPITKPTEPSQETLNLASTITSHALLEYLTQTLDASLPIFSTALTHLRSVHPNSLLEEVLVEYRAKMIHLHSLYGDGGFRPAVLREALEEGLEVFGGHAGMLGMYLGNEARTKIENRLRRFLDGLLSGG